MNLMSSVAQGDEAGRIVTFVDERHQHKPAPRKAKRPLAEEETAAPAKKRKGEVTTALS